MYGCSVFAVKAEEFQLCYFSHEKLSKMQVHVYVNMFPQSNSVLKEEEHCYLHGD